MLSKSIQIVINCEFIFSLILYNILVSIYTTITLLSHLLLSTWDVSQTFAIINNVAVNSAIDHYVLIFYVLWDRCPGGEILESDWSSSLTLLRSLCTIFHEGCQWWMEWHFLLIPTIICFSHSFWYSHPHKCDMNLLILFDLYFSDHQRWTFFHMPFVHNYGRFEEMYIEVLSPIVHRIVLLLLLLSLWILYVSCKLFLCSVFSVKWCLVKHIFLLCRNF